MTRNILNINDFIVLIEAAKSETELIDKCSFDESLIAVAFYGSGNVDLTVEFGNSRNHFEHTKGLALAFRADNQVSFTHRITAEKDLQCIVIATTVENLDRMPNNEGDLFSEFLHELVNPSDHYVEGPQLYMTPEMETIVDSIFNITYEGKTRMMFLRSQVMSLLSHFFGQLASVKTRSISERESSKLLEAKEILKNSLDNPPSLNELAKMIGLNTHSLKKNFKEHYGVPVFKYLQNERLCTAHDLIRKKSSTVQEAAWNVGYDSLSSFSNAFYKKFGYRPSDIKV